jgi:hypothetical protein
MHNARMTNIPVKVECRYITPDLWYASVSPDSDRFFEISATFNHDISIEQIAAALIDLQTLYDRIENTIYPLEAKIARRYLLDSMRAVIGAYVACIYHDHDNMNRRITTSRKFLQAFDATLDSFSAA